MAEAYDDRVSRTEHATRFIKQRVSDIAPTLDSDDSTSENKGHRLKPALLTSVLAGGIAGVVVDITLFPLDTIKTRLQSKEGFAASGGFKGVYKGVVPVLLGSAPTSAIFFATYNTIINTLRTDNSSLNPFVYLVAASAAEIVCASLRLPIEIIKQRKQISNTRSTYIITKTYKKEGIPGFYRGFLSMLLREIPFAAIQYPLWEYMIQQIIIYQNGQELTAFQTACCGAAAGATAAALTTPMDVIKTRVTLAEKEKIDELKKKLNYYIAREVYQDRGISGFFAGVAPRVLWITLGGFIYFGAYEKAKIICERKLSFITNKIQRVRDIAPSYFEEKIETLTFVKEGFCEKMKEGEKECTMDPNKSETEITPDTQKIIDTTLLQPSDPTVRRD